MKTQAFSSNIYTTHETETGLDDNNDFASALEDELGGNESSSTAGGNSRKKKDVKPEAKLQPHLFVQEGTLDNGRRSFRSNAKQEASVEILALAGELEMDVAEVDKGVLNTLCNNRPHQGFVLRCGGLDFSPLRRLPGAGDGGGSAGPKLWLALDEVVDPQNLGKKMRSLSLCMHRGLRLEEMHRNNMTSCKYIYLA